MIICKQKLLFLSVAGFFVTGCELIGPELHEKLPLHSNVSIGSTKQAAVIYPELSNAGENDSNSSNVKAELYPGSGRFIAEVKNNTKPIVAKGEYSLNFDDADLGEVAKVVLGDILGENFVISPKVTGKVTLQTTQPLSRSELLPTLEMLLQINGAVLVSQESGYQIKPKAEALSGSAFTTYSNYKQKIPAGYQIKVVPVRNVAVDELAEIIKPLLQDKTILNVDSVRNMMLIAGTGNELMRAMEMVNAFDVDVMKGRSFGLFPIQNVEASKMIEELQQVFNQDNSKSGKGFFQFMEIERLNSILAITHHVKFLKDIERWILRLDRANTSAGGGVIVYRAQHVDAVELATTLNDIFSQSGSKSRPASVAAGRKIVEVTNKNKTSAKTVDTRTKRGTPSLADIGEVKIIADEVNNALIIVATAQDYAVIQRVIKQLDVMPLQVLIEATIVAVQLTDELEYGIQWFFTHNGDQNAGSSKGISLTDTAAKAAITAATGGVGGFGYSFVSDSGDIRAVLNAAAKDNKINVISSPSLMVLNNQEASIQVGDEVPIRTSESTNTSGSVDPIQTSAIQMRETGVTLNVKPRVNANGLVIMDIEQSVDKAIASSTSGIDSPTIQQRQIKSKVAIQSGETIVLGGLIDETETFEKTGIPVLHELPLIGPLFGKTDKTILKTELVVLITPRVVNTRKDARLITNEFKRKLSGIYRDTVTRKVNKELPLAR